MAVPKKKVSKARRDKRRSNNSKLDMPGMVKCPKCPKGHDYAIAKVQIICPEGISYEQLIGILPK